MLCWALVYRIGWVERAGKGRLVCRGRGGAARKALARVPDASRAGAGRWARAGRETTWER